MNRDVKKVLVLLDTSRACGLKLLSGVNNYSHSVKGQWMLYREPLTYAGNESNFFDWLKKNPPDGIILQENERYNEVLTIKLPLVVAPQIKNTIKKIPRIVCDNASVGKVAARYFLNQGFHSLAFYGHKAYFWSRERGDAFEQEIAYSGFKVLRYEESKTAKQQGDKQKKQLADWLIGLPRKTGLYASNDDYASTIIETATSLGLRVPEGIAVLGTDNDESVCNMCYPALSSIALNFECAGYQAAELLDKLMGGVEVSAAEQIITVGPQHIITRQSSNYLAVDDDDLVAAIQFIINHSNKSLQVSDVAYAICRSRSYLERKFRMILQRTVHDEIKRRRIERVCKELTESDKSITQIALEFEFPALEQFDRYFRREIGMNPRSYRAKFRPKD